MRDEEAQKALDTAVAELDSNVPENFDASVWDRLCRYRRAKIEMEMNVSCVVAVFQYELIARTCCCFCHSDCQSKNLTRKSQEAGA